MRSTVSLAAFSVPLGQPVFIPNPSASEGCREPVFAPCCRDCTLPEAQRRPHKCFCAISPGAVCIDASKAYVGIADSSGSFALEFGFLEGVRCAPFAVGLITGAGPIDAAEFIVDAPSTMSPPPMLPYLSLIKPNGSSENAPSWGRLRPLEALQLLEQFHYGYAVEAVLLEGVAVRTLPLRFFFPVLPSMKLQCQNLTMLLSSGVFGDWVFPVAEPSEAYVGSRWPTFPLNISLWRDDVLAFAFTIWQYLNGQLHSPRGLPSDFNATSCVLNVEGLTDAGGVYLPNATATFTSAPSVPCTPATMQKAIEWTAMLPSMIIVWSKLQGSDQIRPALTFLAMSADYNACFQYALHSLALGVPQSVSVSDTRECFLQPSDPAFFTDPCCNLGLALFQCCAPRSVDVSISAPKLTDEDDSIKAQCRTPRCVQQTIAAIRETQLNSPHCTKEFLELLYAPGFRSDSLQACPDSQFIPASYPNLLLCESDSDCLSGVCAPNPFLLNEWSLSRHMPLAQKLCAPTNDGTVGVACMLRGLHPILRGLLAGRVNVGPSISDEELAALVARSFSAESARWDEGYCPWMSEAGLQTILPADCQGADYGLPDHFCAAGDCTPGLPCFEVSRVQGCFGNYSSFYYADSVCSTAGGIPLPILYAPFDWRITCFFPNVTTPELCFPPSDCQSSRLVHDPSSGRTYCPPYCMLPITTPTDCTCANTIDPDLCTEATEGLVWQPEFGTCEIPSHDALDAICNSLGGTLWHGSLWQTEYLNDEHSCSHLGFCSSDASGFLDSVLGQYVVMPSSVYSQATCEAMIGCDLATHSVNQTDCVTHGLCSSALLYGHCSIAPEGYALDPSCTVGTNVAPSVPGTTCAAPVEATCSPAEPVPDPFPDTIDQCDQTLACATPTSALLTQRNATECAACHGVLKPRGFFTPGEWTNGTWHGFRWMPRNGTLFPYPGDLLYQVNDFLKQSYSSVLYSALLQSFLCERDTLLASMPAIVCDCIEHRAGCFDAPPEIPAGVIYTCSNVPQLYHGSEFIFQVRDSGTPVNASDGVPCRTVSFTRIPKSSFKENIETPFSSLLLAAVLADPYTVVRNNYSAPIGQLRSDVISVRFAGGMPGSNYVITGARMCINFTSGPPRVSRLNVPVIASWSSASNSFTPLSTEQLTIEDDSVCIAVAHDGYYAAFLVARGWQTLTPLEMLPSKTRAVFTMAAVLYGLLFLVCIARLLGVLLVARREQCITGVSFVLLAIFLLSRTILFILLRSGVLSVLGSSSVNLFIVAESSTHLEFLLTVLVLYVWATLYHSVNGRPRHKKLLTICCATVVTGVLVLFSAVAISLHQLQIQIDTQFTADCARPPGTPRLVLLDRIYKSAVALIALVLAILVAVYGGLHVRRLSTLHRGFAFAQVVLVLILTLGGLLLQATLVLYIALRQGNLVVVVVGAAAELLRPAAMLLVLRAVDFTCCSSKRPPGEFISQTLNATEHSYTALEGYDGDF